MPRGAPLTDFTDNLHPEKVIDGFTALDGTVRFYCFVKAALLKTGAREVLDFGAGRGAAFRDDASLFRRHMRDLRTFGARVTACDVDNAVLLHPASDRQIVIEPGVPLPFADATFDVIVSDMTFEHIADANFVASELTRILKPGGYLCARTPNRLGYVRLFSGIIPNALKRFLLRYVQPDRKSEDVFPTMYRMNSPGQVRELFKECSVFCIHDNAEPAYYFGIGLLYRIFLLGHVLTPPGHATTVYFFISKPAPPVAMSLKISQ